MRATTLLRHSGRRAALAFVALAIAAPAASAHVHIEPELVAPGASEAFTIRVPNEREVGTTKVELQIPAGVVPYSFAETPGWKRVTTPAADGSIESISWTGTLAADGYVDFHFLASVPEEPGDLKWGALQTYEGGELVSWIGAPDADLPAPVVKVSADAATDEGGAMDHSDMAAEEEEEEEADADSEPASKATAAADDTSDDGDDSDRGTDWIGRGLAIAALLVGGFAIAQRRTRPDDEPTARP